MPQGSGCGLSVGSSDQSRRFSIWSPVRSQSRSAAQPFHWTAPGNCGRRKAGRCGHSFDTEHRLFHFPVHLLRLGRPAQVQTVDHLFHQVEAVLVVLRAVDVDRHETAGCKQLVPKALSKAAAQHGSTVVTSGKLALDQRRSPNHSARSRMGRSASPPARCQRMSPRTSKLLRLSVW